MSSTKITKHDLDDSVFDGVATEDFVEEKISEIDVSGQIDEHNTAEDAHDGVLAKASHTHIPNETGITWGTTDITAGFTPTSTIYFVIE